MRTALKEAETDNANDARIVYVLVCFPDVSSALRFPFKEASVSYKIGSYLKWEYDSHF